MFNSNSFVANNQVVLLFLSISRKIKCKQPKWCIYSLYLVVILFNLLNMIRVRSCVQIRVISIVSLSEELHASISDIEGELIYVLVVIQTNTCVLNQIRWLLEKMLALLVFSCSYYWSKSNRYWIINTIFLPFHIVFQHSAHSLKYSKVTFHELSENKRYNKDSGQFM